jgi:hypothetical protein
MPRPAFEAAVDTRLLLAQLMKANEGDTISFGTLSEAIGRDVNGGDPHVQSARRMAERDSGAVFSSVHGKGYKRLPPGDVVKASESDLNRLKRAAKRGGRRLSTVNPMVLDQTNRDLYHARLSGFAIITHIAKPGSIEKLAVASRAKGGEELAIAQTLKALAEGAL